MEEYLDVQICRCGSTENKLLKQISKCTYNNKNNDQATWNRNELTIRGVTRSGSKTLKQKKHGTRKT